jgi:arginyl-tRNA--protein-N-Asp/Glu arginylyltransferase
MELPTFSAYPALPPPAAIPLVTLQEHPCAYLLHRLTENRAFVAHTLSPETYHDLMNAGFRRSGRLFYQPICRGCRACIPIRIPTNRFVPSKSQRRCFRRNSDLVVTVSRAKPTDEKFDLYRRYASQRHGDLHANDPETFCSFLYDSPVDTLEFDYRDPSGRLLAVGICDVCSRSLSSVYFYFDPSESRRSLGNFSVLKEIQYSRRLAIAHYYLGYWVAQAQSMAYKTNFQPCELLHPDGVWRENLPVQSVTDVEI